MFAKASMLSGMSGAVEFFSSIGRQNNVFYRIIFRQLGSGSDNRRLSIFGTFE